MSEITTSFSEHAVHDIAGAASYICTKVRPVGNLIVGGHKSVRPVRYRPMIVSGEPESLTDPALWARYSGDAASTRLPVPRLYRRVARTVLRPGALDDHLAAQEFAADAGEGRYVALAWRFNPASALAMVALLDYEQTSAIALHGSYGMRVGRGDLITGVGLAVPDTNYFRPLPDMIEPGETMPLEAWRSEIPIF